MRAASLLSAVVCGAPRTTSPARFPRESVCRSDTFHCHMVRPGCSCLIILLSFSLSCGFLLPEPPRSPPFWQSLRRVWPVRPLPQSSPWPFSSLRLWPKPFFGPGLFWPESPPHPCGRRGSGGRCPARHPRSTPARLLRAMRRGDLRHRVRRSSRCSRSGCPPRKRRGAPRPAARKPRRRCRSRPSRRTTGARAIPSRFWPRSHARRASPPANLCRAGCAAKGCAGPSG